MSNLSSHQASFDENYINLLSYKTVLVGYSGGLDSTVLLYSLNDFFKRRNAKTILKAVHINHNLNPKSDDWQFNCTNFCDQLNIEIICYKINLDTSKGNIENNARNERYKCFEKSIEEFDNNQNSSILVLAHHSNDQAETLLMRLFRGAGTKGATSIPHRRKLNHSNFYLYRPLLSYSKSFLYNYAFENNLSYSEDPSNLNLSFDRNYIRSKIIPPIYDRWPSYNKNFSRFIENRKIDLDLINELAVIDLEKLESKNTIFGHSLLLSPIKLLKKSRRMNVIRYWLDSVAAISPSNKQLNNINNFIFCESQSVELIIDSFRLNKYKDRIYLNDMKLLNNLNKYLSDNNEWLLKEKFIIPCYGELLFLSDNNNNKS